MQSTRRNFIVITSATLAIASLPVLAQAEPIVRRIPVEVLDYDGTQKGEVFKWKCVAGLEVVKNGQVFRFVALKDYDNGVLKGNHIPAYINGEYNVTAMYGVAFEDGERIIEDEPNSPNYGHYRGQVVCNWYAALDLAIEQFMLRREAASCGK